MEADWLRRLRDLLRPGHELTLGHEQPGARLCTLYRIRGHQASPVPGWNISTIKMDKNKTK